MQPGPGFPPPAGVVIPLRAFASGKARLASVLGDAERTTLARAMADCVVDACGDLPLVVVSSAAEVHAWAADREIPVIDDPGTGLDGAALEGVEYFRRHGAERVVVAHADLPRARPGALVPFSTIALATVAIVPCHRDDGTPVLSVPTEPAFPFAYGIGSARRHAQIARDLGLAVEIVRDPDLGFDIDLPEDLPS